MMTTELSELWNLHIVSLISAEKLHPASTTLPFVVWWSLPAKGRTDNENSDSTPTTKNELRKHSILIKEIAV